MLSEKILQYTTKTQTLYLPYLWEKWGIPPQEFTEALCEVWDRFDNPRMVDKLLILNVNETPDYYEVCNQPYKRGKYIHKKNYWNYCRINQRKDQHVSTFSHDKAWIDNFNKTGSVSCRNTTVGTDYIFLELDRESLTKATEDALNFYNTFPYTDYCSLWYSGNNSIHVQIDSSLFGKPMGNQHSLTGRRGLIYNLAHRLGGDIRYNNGVVDPWNMDEDELRAIWEIQFGSKPDLEKHELKQQLENIDPNLFGTNSLIRQPYSIHEKGKKRKVEITPDHTKCKRKFDIKENISYVNTPFLIHWVYECWEGKKKKRKKIDVDGDKVIQLFSEAFEFFDPKEANSQGWVNGLYSPFYNDTNPDVSVNIETGFVHDFGDNDYSLNFNQFKEKWNEQK